MRSSGFQSGTARHSQAELLSQRRHLGEEEGDDDEPDDVVAEGAEALREGQRLGGDRHRRRQERPRARRQRRQHQACTSVI